MGLWSNFKKSLKRNRWNAEINSKLTYKRDTRGEKGKEDYWQTPKETLALRTADCIAHYERLWVRSNGVVCAKRIEEVSVGDCALSYNFESKSLEYKRITNKWYSGEKLLNRVRFTNGTTADMSGDHKIFKRDKQKHTAYVPVKLRDFLEKPHPWYYKTPTIKKLPYEACDKENLTNGICFIIGFYLAEGWSSYGKVGMSAKELPELVCPILDNSGVPYSLSFRKSDQLPHVNFLKGHWLKGYLKGLKTNSFEMQLPVELYNLPESKLESLLEGLFAGDGHIHSDRKSKVYSTSSDDLKRFITEICYKLGSPVNPYLQIEHGGLGSSPIWRLYDNPNSYFKKGYGFEGLSETSIKSNEILDYVPMYDIEVEDNHNFVLADSGVIVHNCEDIAILKAFQLEGGKLVIGELPEGMHMVAEDGEGYQYDLSGSVRKQTKSFTSLFEIDVNSGKSKDLSQGAGKYIGVSPHNKLYWLEMFGDLLKRMRLEEDKEKQEVSDNYKRTLYTVSKLE